MLSKQRLSWIKELNHYQRLNQTYTFYFKFFHDGMQGHSVDFKFCMCWVILKKIFAPPPPPPAQLSEEGSMSHCKAGFIPRVRSYNFRQWRCLHDLGVQGRKGIYSMFKAPRFREFRFSYFWVTRCNKRGGGNVTLKEPIYIFLNIQT